MPNALIIGAFGYVGSATSQQLLRQGNFYAYGIAETDQDELALARDEIQPLRGDVTTAAGILALLQQGSIDVIIDTTSYNDTSTKLNLLRNVIEAAKLREVNSSHAHTHMRPKLGLVTVSGVWTQGSTEDPKGSFRRMSPADRSLQPEADLVESKLAYEQVVLEARETLNVAIVRPGFIWARGGSAWTRILSPLVERLAASQEEKESASSIQVAVDPEDQHYAFTHIDDVAAAVELAALKLPALALGTYPVFDLVGEIVAMVELCRKDAFHFGCVGEVKLVKPSGVGYLDTIGGQHDVDSTNATVLLGWLPRKRHFLKDMHIYARSFLAVRSMALQLSQTQ